LNTCSFHEAGSGFVYYFGGSRCRCVVGIVCVFAGDKACGNYSIDYRVSLSKIRTQV